MAKTVLREVLKSIHEADFYTIMCDETTDNTAKEQAVICIRHVSDDYEVSEDFIGLYQIDSIKSETIFEMEKDVLSRIGLPISKMRGQCYDGAANMSGEISGVVKRVQDLESKAIYIHCYGHLVNLASGDTIKNSHFLKTALENANEIIKLVHLSPRRTAIFAKIKIAIQLQP